jgi:hypothetical protein
MGKNISVKKHVTWKRPIEDVETFEVEGKMIKYSLYLE